MPSPVSATSMRTDRRRRPRRETSIASPAPVWRTAFEIRFRSTCSSASSSPSTIAPASASQPASRARPAPASASTTSPGERRRRRPARASPPVRAGRGPAAAGCRPAGPSGRARRSRLRPARPQLGRAPRRDERHLEVAAGDRERRAQLVRRVVHEPALGGEGDLEPVEHRVDRGRDLGDLVMRRHRPHPHRQVAGGHARRPLRDPRERGERPARHEPRGAVAGTRPTRQTISIASRSVRTPASASAAGTAASTRPRPRLAAATDVLLAGDLDRRVCPGAGHPRGATACGRAGCSQRRAPAGRRRRRGAGRALPGAEVCADEPRRRPPAPTRLAVVARGRGAVPRRGGTPSRRPAAREVGGGSCAAVVRVWSTWRRSIR